MSNRILFLLALAVGAANSSPVGQSTTFAILHASIHDTLNAIDARYRSFTPGLPQDPGAPADAVIAASSRSVLTTLLPDPSDFIRLTCAKELAAIADGPIDLKEHELDSPLELSSTRHARDPQFVKELGRVGRVRRRGLDRRQAARAFALINVAMADAYMADSRRSMNSGLGVR